jgi:hypothetical protein
MVESALVTTAMEFLARASSTSEVLTLNITNLIILLIAKAIIIGIGVAIGTGGSSSYSARSSDRSYVTQSDLTGGMCFMMYTSGAEEKLSCIQRSACDDPKTAADYVTAAKMWYKVHKLLDIPFGPKYEVVLNALEDAKNHALAGGDCSVYKW